MEIIKRDKYYFHTIIILIFVSSWMMLTALGFENYEPVTERITEDNIKAEILNEKVESANSKLIVNKYIRLDDMEDLQLVEDIELNTPLDFDTAFVVVAYSRKFNIRPSLLLAMIEVESNFDNMCVGTHEDRGYLQIIPSTEKWLAEVFGEELGIEYDPERIFEAEYNIGLGAAYISLLQNAYGNDINRILSEYNRGPYNLKKFYEMHNTYETAYSRSILKREKKYEQFDR